MSPRPCRSAFDSRFGECLPEALRVAVDGEAGGGLQDDLTFGLAGLEQQSAALLVLLGWAGRWEPVLMLVWLASAGPVFTPLGKRVAVRLAYGSSRPSARQRALLEPAWRQVLARCQVDPADVDLYVRRSRAVNAFAVGGRSVAITTGAGADFLTHSLTQDHLAGLLAHELGHRARRGGASRWSRPGWPRRGDSPNGSLSGSRLPSPVDSHGSCSRLSSRRPSVSRSGRRSSRARPRWRSC